MTGARQAWELRREKTEKYVIQIILFSNMSFIVMFVTAVCVLFLTNCCVKHGAILQKARARPL